MIIDLHNHTNRYSSCSVLTPEKLAYLTVKRGLDAVAITEHNYCWEKGEIENLKEKSGLKSIFRGQEVDTDIGHVLVYGFYESVSYLINYLKLIDRVHNAGGVAVFAHPFRWGQFKTSPDKEIEKIFKSFDAVEIYNSNLNIQEIIRGEEFIKKNKKIPFISGSDSHAPNMVGRFPVCFADNIETEEELVRAIKRHRWNIINYR